MHERLKRKLSLVVLLAVTLITLATPILSGTGGEAFQAPEPPIVAEASDGAYDDISIELAAATAFYDARRVLRKAELDAFQVDVETFKSNLAKLTEGSHWGNVGLFVGPKGTSENSDIWSIFLSRVTVSKDQMTAYDSYTGNAFSKYRAFGGAVQKLNTQAMKAKGASSSMSNGLNALSATGAKIANLGLSLINDYNPAPLVLALFDADELNSHPNNRLVQFVNGTSTVADIFKFFGSPTRFGVSMMFLILTLLVLLLLAAGAFLALINGRAAGENIRKMFVKIVIGCIAVPLIARALDTGIGFLQAVAVAEAENPEETYIKENLNLADWYACGFAIPSGKTISINKWGEFVMQQDVVKAINEYTYKRLHLGDATAKNIKDKMEEYQSEANGIQMGIGFSEPMGASQTVSLPLLGDIQVPQEAWQTKDFYQLLDNFGANYPLDDGLEVDLSEIAYLFKNGLSISEITEDEAVKGYTITGSSEPYGISPIAATNLMRTTFTGAAMIANSNNIMGSVVFDVDAGGAGSSMGALSRFIATFTMVVAAIKGLFTIFTAGFAGVVVGGAKSAGGSSAGFGQAVGGVLALVGGVFGIGLIMTISFQLLQSVYGVIAELLSGTDAIDEMMRPIREAVGGIWVIGPILVGVLKGAASFVMTLIVAMTVPKFGGIPITLFCQALADLPNRFAERAQQIENKFTGDFRAGGGHGNLGAQASQLAGQAAHSAKMGAMAMGAGAAAIGGAALGYGLNKAGGALAKKYEGKDTGEDGKKSLAGGAEDPETDVPPQDPTPEEAAALAGAQDGSPENGNGGPEGKDHEGKERDGTIPAAPEAKPEAGGMTINEGNDAAPVLKEESKENTENHDGDDHMSEQFDATDTLNQDTVDTENTGEEVVSDSAHSEEVSSAIQSAETMNGSEEQISDTVNSDSVSASEASSMATVMPTEADGKEPSEGGSSSMAGNPEAARAGQRAGSSMSASDGNPKAESGQTASSSPSDQKTLTKEQKHNRRMQAIAKGLQSAGAHTTGRQAMAGIAAGAVHMVGGFTGTQSVTGKALSAAHNYKSRQDDVRAGRVPGETREQEKKKRPAGGGGGRPPAGPPPKDTSKTAKRSAALMEALAREAKEQHRNR